MYLIRDHEEAALHLPSGDREVPLIIGDRNLDVDAAGNLSGDLLYKVSTFQTEPEHLTVPFSGPFTLVNGKIWPFLAVRRRWYRFRIVNTCNARTYQLQLVANDGTQLVGVMQQIGSDGGLFGSPITVDRLTVAPGERADVLINFAPFAGQQLRLVNLLNPPPEPGGVTPNPDVMQFRVAPGAAAPDPFSLPTTVSPSFVRLDHDSAPHGHRWIALTPPGPGHPELWEMEEVDPGSVPVPSDGVVQLRTSDGQLHTLRRVARGFRDRVNFVIPADSWQQWAFIHLGGPAGHPMHIHLARVQALVREQYAVTTFDSAVGGTVAPIEYDAPGVLDPNEQGWKDVVRVGPGQLVRVLGRFSGGNGAFVYHCHIFEHEDEAMMRPFVVMPESVMPFDPHSPGGHDHDH
jgi:FtsP/CotA-like multicopper oxidase with cupredoxin domain